MLFSEHFRIRALIRDDWFDAILDTDTRLFVDPFLIFKERIGAWSDGHGMLIDHFNSCFTLIAEGGLAPHSLPYRKALALLRFPEPREFCLGYTSRGTAGLGGGTGHAEAIANAMAAAIRRGIKQLRHFEELGILNEGIGPDRISDFTCSILKRKFVAYTRTVAKRHGLALEKHRLWASGFDDSRKVWESSAVDILSNPFTLRPLLLVPRRFLRDLPTLNATDWWDWYESEQVKVNLNYEVLHSVDKDRIVAAARQDFASIRRWEQVRESGPAVSYDIARDKNGVYQWDPASREYANKNPLTIPPAHSDEDFLKVIQTLVTAFQKFVEEQGGWRLLWNDDKTRKPEEAAQLLFKGLVQSYCHSNDIVIDREVELGRGPVDFKFSSGYRRRALLEVKKLDNTKFWHGLRKQLPSYMKSDECRNGWFVAIRYDTSPTSDGWAKELPKEVRDTAKDHNVRLRHTIVDAQPKASASRI